MLARSNTFSQQKIHADLLSKIFDIFLVKKLCFSFEKRDFCKYFAMRALRIHDVAIRMHSRTSTIEIRVFLCLFARAFKKKGFCLRICENKIQENIFQAVFFCFIVSFCFFVTFCLVGIRILSFVLVLLHSRVCNVRFRNEIEIG